jgi:hypothetical protein
MGPDQNTGLALVRLAHSFARFDGFGKSCLQIVGLSDARAIATPSAKVEQTICLWLLETAQRLRNHLRQRVLPRPFGSGDDYCMREAFAREHLADSRDGIVIAEKTLKGH